MPSIFGASPASTTPVSTLSTVPHALPGRGFKARQGPPRRLHTGQPAPGAQQQEPFALVRAGLASCTGRAARCRERIAGMANRVLGRTRPASDAAFAASAARGKPETPESKAALLACAPQVNAIGRLYGNEDGPVKLSADLIHDLIKLSNSMKMLRRHDQDPADFLYPAVRAMHGATCGMANAARHSALANLLCDLSGRAPGDPDGLRAQMTRKGGGLDIWMANNLPPSYERAPDAARLGMSAEINVLLDGLAGAARQVLREQLLAQVPAWAREARPGLFQEAGTLYASVQRWRGAVPTGDASAATTGDNILQASPANVVDVLLNKAARLALDTAAAPTGDLAPLLGVLSAHLSRVVARIDASLHAGRVAEHTPAADVAALRQKLMREVLRETGILREVERLRNTGVPSEVEQRRNTGDEFAERVAPAYPPARGGARSAAPIVSTVFRPSNAAPHPMLATRMKRAAANARRDISNFLSACRPTKGKPGNWAKDKSLPIHKLATLHEARKALEAVHGAAAQDIWEGLIKDAMASAKDDDLVSLNTGALWAFAHPDPGLVAKLENLAGGNRILVDIWHSVRTESAKRNVGPTLQKWCETLAGSTDMADMADGKELFRQIDGLRGQIDVLKDDKVETAALLAAAMARISDQQLGILIDTLGWPARPVSDTPARPTSNAPVRPISNTPAHPALDAPARTATLQATAGFETPTLRQRVMHTLGQNHRGLSHDTGLPDRDAKNARVFLNQLFNAACTESEKRLDTLRDGLIKDFRSGLFAQASQLHATLATPEACATNGPVAAALEQLIQDAVKQGRLTHEHGEGAAAARMGTRFLRTAYGYDVAGAMARPICRDTANLHARLDTAMKQLNMAGFWSEAALTAWRNSAVDYIVREAGIWDRIDIQLARRLPRVIRAPMDAPSWAGAARPASPASSDDGYSTIAERPAGSPAGMRPGPAMAEDRYAASPTDEEGYMVPRPLAVPAPLPEPLLGPLSESTSQPMSESLLGPLCEPSPTSPGHRASKAASDDSGFEDDTRSQASVAGHLVDTRLAAALQAALEQRRRGTFDFA